MADRIALTEFFDSGRSDDSSLLSSPPSQLDINASDLESTESGRIRRRAQAKRENGSRSQSSSVEPVIRGTPPSKKRQKTSGKSPYFPKRPTEKVSCIPFPPLSSTSFGIVQERLCHEPFKLLLACIFLNKTRGSVSMPVFFDLISRYQTPEALAEAAQEDIVKIIQHLGLQNQRAATFLKLAKTWLEHPPEKGKRYRRLHYPRKNDGKDIRKSENPIGDDDERVAWEIGHLPGIGAYGIDSWRIFCRDELRGLPTGIPEEFTPEAVDTELKKEWTRVLPQDKELRAYLRWRWLRLGWYWDRVTGETKKVDPELFKEALEGGVLLEGEEQWFVQGIQRHGCQSKGSPQSEFSFSSKAAALGSGDSKIQA
ncbi:hypothetical protein MMC20_008113 [Loxospora ochrophaea]|nr:hypothetical protein [Loxospora ochrophaea]